MKIGVKIGMIAAGVFVILLCVGYSSFICMQTLIQTNLQAMSTSKILRELENLQGRVADLESSVRAYVVTDDDKYLGDKEAAKVEIDESLKSLKQLTQENTERTKMVGGLESLVAQKAQFTEELVSVMKANGYEKAIALVKNDRGRQLMERIRRLVADRVRVEEELLSKQINDAHQLADSTVVAISAGGILAFVFVSLFSYITALSITRSIEKVIRALERVGLGRYEPVVGIDSKDELGELAQAFNQMCHILKRGHEKQLLADEAEASREKVIESARTHSSSFESKVGELSVAADEMAKVLDQQPQEFTRTIESSQRSIDESRRMREKLDQITSQLSRSDTLGRNGHQTLEDINKQVSRLVSESDSAAHRISQVADKLQDLSVITASIEDIANRINIISLNSSLESSRQTVNDELKSISDLARQENLRIKQLVVGIEKLVHRASSDSEHSVESVSQAVKAISQLGERLDSLLNPLTEAKRESAILKDQLGRQETDLSQVHYGLERLNLSLQQKLFFMKQIKATSVDVASFGNELSELLNNGVSK